MIGGWSGLTILDNLFFLALGRQSVVSLHACASTYCLLNYYGYSLLLLSVLILEMVQY